jgi:hypothetical protein
MLGPLILNLLEMVPVHSPAERFTSDTLVKHFSLVSLIPLRGYTFEQAE